jgi:hypothetical protein
MLWIIIIAFLIYDIFAPDAKIGTEKRKQALNQKQGIIDAFNDD